MILNKTVLEHVREKKNLAELSYFLLVKILLDLA